MYFLTSGSGSGSVADDGPHKLITPDTVLSEYKKGDASADGLSSDDIKEAEKWGVKNPKDVDAQYTAGDENNPLAQKYLQFSGVYGEIADPEKVVDAMFAEMKKSSKEDEDAELIGEPRAYEPDGLDGAVLKCQEAKVKDTEGSSSGGPSEIPMSYCVWGDHSTLALVLPMDIAGALTGKGTTPEQAAEMAAKLRKEVRVKL
ncbi:hypothetical protein [Streptomyces sp. GC420]|uniref:hypothetical protein n=1 Tax=Streptomyces sp. GC420 TaxID=2697568 RepID=UPI0014150D3F|nr:hypothetical protein [Streptomyces sp. GC420]NBM20919.1 hypothetical protein [Streptomyces sp. GC420]